MVRTYYDELEYRHPLINTNKFLENSYAKWACTEIIREIDNSEELPFHMTSFELLNYFSEKMKTYASMNAKNSFGFLVAADTAEYFIEQTYLYDAKRKFERRPCI